MTENKFCLALDLKDDPETIAAYEEHHRQVWPEVLENIRKAGITDLEIYRTGNRLFMIMVVSPGFSFSEKARLDAESSVVQKWEELMWKYQQALPHAAPGEKWVRMERIFSLG